MLWRLQPGNPTLVIITMPLELRRMTEADAMSWTRVRHMAYYGPTHDVLHNGPMRESSLDGVAEDRKREMQQATHMWYWKVVDTDEAPGPYDPADNGGRTISISVWSMNNVGEIKMAPGFLPPELRLDALNSLFQPLRAAQERIMGTSRPYFKLNQLATHPEFEGRGAARLMLDWGLGKADAEGLVVYLDATERARPLYERRGFKVVQAVEWDRVPWGGEGKDCHSCMVREAGK
jgi:WD repeat-containing protein 48